MKRCEATHIVPPSCDCGECDSSKERRGPANWLDWQAPDDCCPDCGGPTTWFEPGWLGKLLDQRGIHF